MSLHVAERDIDAEVSHVVFGSNSPLWHGDKYYNLLFLQSMQNYFNDLLVANGFVFINDILQMIGLRRTPAGQLVGWLIEETPFIDFGIRPDDTENSFDINFNTESVIFDKLY